MVGSECCLALACGMLLKSGFWSRAQSLVLGLCLLYGRMARGGGLSEIGVMYRLDPVGLVPVLSRAMDEW